MLKDAKRSKAISVTFRVLDSYKNVFYAVPPESVFSENIEAAVARESELPELECWEGDPGDLDAIQNDYWTIRAFFR